MLIEYVNGTRTTCVVSPRHETNRTPISPMEVENKGTQYLYRLMREYMTNNRGRKPRWKKRSRAAAEQTSDELVAWTGVSFAEMGAIRRAEISPQRGDYQALQRLDNDARRASGAAIAQCAEEVEARRSAAAIAEQHTRPSEQSKF